MKNKVLIQLVVPCLETKYDLFVPINKRVGNVIDLLCKTLNEITNGLYDENSEGKKLYNAITGELYNMQDIIRKTNIRNGSKIVLL